MDLCHCCQFILNPPAGGGETRATPQNGWNVQYQGRSGHSLETEAETGCRMCKQVWNSLDNTEKAILRHEDCTGLTCRILWNERESRFKHIHVFFDLHDEPEFHILRAFNLFVDKELATVGSVHIENRTNTQQVIAKCRNWLNECNQNHAVCHKRIGHKEDWLPTRLLDTGQRDGPVSLRLIPSRNLDPSCTSYLALSHCWGKLQLLTLTQASLEPFQNSIPWDSLPHTFQHAVVATRALGYRYLWIDSLCIIQDSIEDWRDESAVMGEVYSQTDCVLAATGSSDGTGGLFRSRDPAFVSPVSLQAEWGAHIEAYVCFKADLWEKGVANAPLNQRGWVVQERMLSPRTLHFGTEQVFWECRELEACEVFPDRIPYPFFEFGHREANAFKRWMTATKIDDAQEVRPASYESWSHMVDVYMKSALTKGEDKLIALSGMAKKAQLVLHDEYIAGLWRKSLIDGMLWYVEFGFQADYSYSRRPSTYRSPSWSWAAVDGVINHPTHHIPDQILYGDFVTVLDVAIEPAGSDRMGQIKSAHLMIEGVVKRIRKPTYIYATASHICGEYFADDREYSESVEDFYALPLRYHRITVEEEEELWGLVLTPVKSLADCFERVGLFRLAEGDDIVFVGSQKPVCVVDNFGLSRSEKRRVIQLL